jgi:peptide chain release factor 2
VPAVILFNFINKTDMNNIKEIINNLANGVGHLGDLLAIEQKRGVIQQLQLKMAQSDFWQNQETAGKVVNELKYLKDYVDDWDGLRKKLNDINEMMEVFDSSYEQEIVEEIKQLQKDYDKLKLRVLFSGKFDNSCAIVEINAGAGGTEACDWTGMLYRMYTRWAENKKYKLKVLEELSGDEAGIKNITFFVEGRLAYGLLKAERGVHRLVRISPFDANKRRHTSFASVDVLPQIEDDVNIEIKPEDLKIDTFRASGAGGQHVNKTESAVRITHLPTGIIVGSQSERSQHKNKQAALSVLKAKLYELNEAEKQKKLDKVAGDKRKIEWGSQIRSYVLHPYLLVKDHRTDYEDHDAWAVLDGRLDDFIYAYLNFSSRI